MDTTTLLHSSCTQPISKLQRCPQIERRLMWDFTHPFDVVSATQQENVNPIEKVERSTLIMASTVHQQPTAALINASSAPRLLQASPQLFLKDVAPE